MNQRTTSFGQAGWSRLLSFLHRHPGVYTSLLVGPSAAVTLLLVAVPTLIIIYYSVLTRDTNGLLLPILTLQNYVELFTEERYAVVLFRSLGLAFATTALCFMISFPIAYWIAMYGGRWRNFLIFLIILPSWTSYLVRVYAWLFLLKDSGFVLSALKFLNIIPEDARVQLLFDWKAVIIVMVYSYMDFMIIPLYAALIRLDRSALEADSDVGARPWRRIFSVTLPMIRGGILAGSVLVFVPAIGEFLVPSLIGGNKVNMVGNLLDLTFLQTDNWALGSAMAVVLSVLILVMISFYLRSAGKEGAMERLT
jgi:ABC-type spermidine/putrescine transport system permease subunit I